MAFELPQLPYEKTALEPYISERTLEFHYGKHHKAYVDKTNELIQGTEFENASLEEIIKRAGGALFNNGAQVWNHTFYFNQFSPDGQKKPEDRLKEAIDARFGTFDMFMEEFSKSAAGIFGSGWAWLVKNNNNELEIVQASNAVNPLREGKKPLLTCDVWEHAYYLDKQNARPKYIEDFWKIIDWKVIAERFES
jgi:superoxide dismutase, Fe-Mn family